MRGSNLRKVFDTTPYSEGSEEFEGHETFERSLDRAHNPPTKSSVSGMWLNITSNLTAAIA